MKGLKELAKGLSTDTYIGEAIFRLAHFFEESGIQATVTHLGHSDTSKKYFAIQFVERTDATNALCQLIEFDPVIFGVNTIVFHIAD